VTAFPTSGIGGSPNTLNFEMRIPFDGLFKHGIAQKASIASPTKK
jgi:hypothetical protein